MGYVAESKLNMLSPTGRSQMWDIAADGYARGVSENPTIDGAMTD